jgi:methyltransferase (TIGR00027 family)
VKEDRPSLTAAYVAGCRALGNLLPDGLRLADDPFGARFAGPTALALVRALDGAPAIVRNAVLGVPGLHRNVLWLQLRTRALDDELLAFARAGGRQVLLLGAGFDCRAARFARELGEAVVFEVDHPATQARKRAVLADARAASARVEYVTWNFERDPLPDLPARLARHGHDPRLPTLTIWEGVTMYLTPAAIDASVAAVRALSGPGSLLAFSYFDRAVVEHPSPFRRIAAQVVARAGEPFRFGWDPEALPAWLHARGFSLRDDGRDTELAARLFPPRHARGFPTRGNHIAVAQPL